MWVTNAIQLAVVDGTYVCNGGIDVVVKEQKIRGFLLNEPL